MHLAMVPEPGGGGALTIWHEDGATVGTVPGWSLTAAIKQGLTPEEIADLAHDAQVSVEPPQRYLPPILPGKVIAIGLNYQDHVRETGMDAPARPLIFAKFPSAICGSGDTIYVDRRQTSRVDWEGELAVIIGRRLRFVSEREALDGVFGYTVANDISARDVQFAEVQWVRGKSFDTFCPLGPAVVPASSIPNPQDLMLTTRVNGEVVQQASTSDMVFGVAEIISYCSQTFTLEPGDVVLTGTPWGCGEFMDPPRSLGEGDEVEVEIEDIGCLRNTVVEISEDVAVAPAQSYDAVGPEER
jgi:2-keto-4-pentenoate hydratase/2-oxohepta-3-ene-1,7-dioic acid hydratase in catechol pathway